MTCYEKDGLSDDDVQARLWPRIVCVFASAFVTRLLTPRSRKSGYGLLLGCRSPLDGGHEKKIFYAFPPQKPMESSSDGRDHHRNRSGVVELVGREPLIFAKVENGVTKFLPQSDRKSKKNHKKNVLGTAVSVGNFHFRLFWPRDN